MIDGKEFKESLSKFTAQQLADAFNKQVGQVHWVSARGRYLHALREAFKNKGIDFSCVTNSSGGFNLAKGNAVFLQNGRLKRLGQGGNPTSE